MKHTYTANYTMIIAPGYYWMRGDKDNLRYGVSAGRWMMVNVSQWRGGMIYQLVCVNAVATFTPEQFAAEFGNVKAEAVNDPVEPVTTWAECRLTPNQGEKPKCKSAKRVRK